nr:60S ribosomal protein L12 [Ipomoea batatas]GMD69453.1 60S ribosomal protein L12 [Ipomoea batatas]GME01665.1 60S ribosomal protein L12 [Ipomoea batatas]
MPSTVHPTDTQGNVAVVFDVLRLLPVTLRLLEGLDDKGGSGGDDRDLGLTVLNRELDGDAEALPILGGFLGNVLTNLLGRETERADFRSERTRSSDLAAGDSDEHLDDLSWIELRRHFRVEEWLGLGFRRL